MTRHFLFSLALCAAPALQAQQTMPDMPNMPGMGAPAPKQAQPPAPNWNGQKPEGRPPDMQGMEHDRNKEAQGSARSLEKSAEQQQGQEGRTPDATSDQQSIAVPVGTLQEPEALDFRTGGSLPAPELLREVAARPPMRLDEFLQSADRSNPTLGEAARNVERSRAQARQAGLPPDPVLGYSSDQVRGGEYHGGEQGAFVSQEFVLGHKLALRRGIYQAEGKQNEYAAEAQRARVHNAVASAFFTALAAQQSVVIHDRLLKLALDVDANTHELNRIGQADAAAILSSEVGAEQARVDFLAAQRMFLAHYARLAALAGLAGGEVHPLGGALVEPPSFDPDELVRRDVEESPLVKEAQAGTALNEARLKDAKRERVPNLSVTAGEWYSGEEVRSGAHAGWESFADAGVQLPLWNRNQGNIDAAKALVARSGAQVDRARLWTRSRAEPMAEEYRTAQFTAGRYRTEMIPRARRAYELQVTKYQQMALDYPAVLAAQHMLFTLQLGYTDALADQWRAAIALENYALSDGLDAPASAGSDATTINLPTARESTP